MPFGLGERTDLVSKLEGLGEVLHTKDALQLGSSVALDDLPVRDLFFEFGDLLVGDSRGIGAARRASGFL